MSDGLDVLLRSRGWDVDAKGCWNWKPKKMRLMLSVARLAYQAWVNPELEDGHQIRRLCHNKRCINPDHLARAGERSPIPEQFSRTGEAKLDRSIREDHATGWYGISDLSGMYSVPVSRVEKALRSKGKETT